MPPERGVLPFAQGLPVLMAARGLSLRAVAKAANVSPSHLSRAVRGVNYKTPGPKLVISVAVALGLPEDYFPEAREARVVDRIKADGNLRDRLYDDLG
jgi:transcriptional regulator with XRE-family HTH domain